MSILIRNVPIESILDPEKRRELEEELGKFLAHGFQAQLVSFEFEGRAKAEFPRLNPILKDGEKLEFKFDVRFPDGRKAGGIYLASSCVPEELRFLRTYHVASGAFIQEGKWVGDWSIYKHPTRKQEDGIQLNFELPEQSYSIFSTDAKFVDKDGKPDAVFLMTERSNSVCDLDAAPAKAKKTLSEAEAECLKRAKAAAEKSEETSSEPVRIIVGCTLEAIEKYSKSQLEEYLKAFEDDIAQSILNSPIDDADEIEFSVLPDVVETGKYQAADGDVAGTTLSSEHLIPILVDASGRFEKLHKAREAENADVVILLTYLPGSEAHESEEFAIVDLFAVTNGPFSHELGHIILNFACVANQQGQHHNNGYTDSSDPACITRTIMVNAGAGSRVNKWSHANSANIPKGHTTLIDVR